MARSPHPLIDKLQLEPHPEGGYYRRVFESDKQVRSPVHQLPRPAMTHIYFLLLEGQVSRFHRVLHDEIWNHYAGAPLRLYHIHQQQLLLCSPHPNPPPSRTEGQPTIIII